MSDEAKKIDDEESDGIEFVARTQNIALSDEMKKELQKMGASSPAPSAAAPKPASSLFQSSQSLKKIDADDEDEGIEFVAKTQVIELSKLKEEAEKTDKIELKNGPDLTKETKISPVTNPQITRPDLQNKPQVRPAQAQAATNQAALSQQVQMPGTAANINLQQMAPLPAMPPMQMGSLPGSCLITIPISEWEMRVRMAAHEEKSRFVAEYYSEAKLLEYKVNQILQKLNSPNPQVQKLIGDIKKMLADHAKMK